MHSEVYLDHHGAFRGLSGMNETKRSCSAMTTLPCRALVY